jgi:hypothetical protein
MRDRLNIWQSVDLKVLTYTSWARPGIGADDVEEILSSARINNPLDGLTGVLIFNGTAFLQVVEGSESAVDGLTARLQADPRHFNMSIRDQRLIETRTFPDWSMAYVRLEDGSFEGEEAVTRALGRDLPQGLRNIVLGLTLALGEDRAAS